MKQRIITAVIGIAVLLTLLYSFYTPIFNVVAGIVYVIAVYEVYGAMKEKNSRPVMVCMAAFGFILLNQQYLEFWTPKTAVIFFMTVYSVCVVFFFHSVDFKTVSASIAYSFYVLMGFYSMLDIKAHMKYELYGWDAAYMFVLCLIISWCCDIFAYFSGYFFGKHKMAPVLSPKKTVEGAIGGVIGSVLCACLSLYGYSLIKPMIEGSAKLYSAGFKSYLFMAFIAFAGALLSMVGDLFASAVKRQTGIKDYGNIIPGHGGVIDRFDSVFILAPFIWMLSDLVIGRGGVFGV